MGRYRPVRSGTLLLLVLVSATAVAGDIRLRLEPFPPLIREDGGGLVVKMLKEVAGEQGLTLDIRTVSYSRARYQLRNGEADLFSIPAGLAVADTRAGRALQERLEPLLGNPEEQTRFEEYLEYIQLPDKGRVDQVLSSERDR